MVVARILYYFKLEKANDVMDFEQGGYTVLDLDFGNEGSEGSEEVCSRIVEGFRIGLCNILGIDPNHCVGDDFDEVILLSGVGG